VREQRRAERERRDSLIRTLARRGDGIKAIARSLALDPKTVRRVVRGGVRPASRPRRSLLDAYRPGQILRLADRIGVLRVAEALRQADRYGAYDSNAVERIATGKPPRRSSKRLEEPGAPPQNIRDYLRGAGTFQRPPSEYTRLSRTKENDDGQRRERAPDGQPATAPSAPRRSEPR
jgi:hypothetical protein